KTTCWACAGAQTARAATVSARLTALFSRQLRGEGVENRIHISHSLGFEEFTGEAGCVGTAQDSIDEGLIFGRSGAAKRQSHARQSKVEQPSPVRLSPVVGALRRREGDQLQLPSVQSETSIQIR